MRKAIQNIEIPHKWFAWYPVEINGHWVWLEYVQRKWVYDMYISSDFSGYSHFEGGWSYWELV